MEIMVHIVVRNYQNAIQMVVKHFQSFIYQKAYINDKIFDK
jgi:hypothetical protein